MVERQVDRRLHEVLDALLRNIFIKGINTRHADNLAVVPVGPDGRGNSARAGPAFADGPLWWVWVIRRDLVNVFADRACLVALFGQQLDLLVAQEEEFIFLPQ